MALLHAAEHAFGCSALRGLNTLGLPSNPGYRFDMPTTPTPLQAHAFQLLGVTIAV